MGCLLLLFTLISPRLAMVAIWLLSDWVDRVFNGWLIPLLGIILLPWTTLLYTIGFIVSGDTAAPWGWLGAIIGLFLDIAVHAGSAVKGRERYRPPSY
jgi:hypothetical protein